LTRNAHPALVKNSARSRPQERNADFSTKRIRALTTYKDFLTLWKDADPDIPIYKQAKAEYAKLQ